jgi:hypothetical protein
MKNIIKSLMVLLSSVSLFSTAFAGEMSVTGTEKATYHIASGSDDEPGIVINKHLDFTASGETDLGAWTYQIQMEPSTAGVQTIADSKLTLTTGFGTLGVFVSEGSLDLEDAGSRSVYARPTDTGFDDGQVDNPGVSAYNNAQYHSPAGLLPFGIVGKIAYAPSADTTINDSNTLGAQTTKAAGTVYGLTSYQVTATPMDGLALGASYSKANSQGIAGTKDQAELEYGDVYVKYDIGAIGLGYSQSRYTPVGTTAAAQVVEYYKADNYSIAFSANENLSLSYEVEKSTRYTAETASAAQEANKEITSKAIQAAYTVGGMTLALGHQTHDNVGYITGYDVNTTLVAVTMAF